MRRLVRATCLGALRRPRRGRAASGAHSRRTGTRLLPGRRRRAPGTVDEVAFYVLPYMKGTAVLDKPRRCPGSRSCRPSPPATRSSCRCCRRRRRCATRRAARHQHRRTGGGPGPGQRTAPGQVRPRPGPRYLASSILGRSLADQRVLIIGYGHIGPAIERRLQGFEVASITRVAPARPLRAAAGSPGRRPAPAAAPGRRRLPHRPAHTRRPRACSAPGSSACCRTARCWSTWPAASWSTPPPCSPSCRPGGYRRARRDRPGAAAADHPLWRHRES